MAEVTDLDAACIRVLREYGMMESRLADVLSAVTGLHWADGLRLFAIVQSARVRHELIGEFIRTKAPHFAPAWDQILPAVRKVDARRNQIAHWQAVVSHGDVMQGDVKRHILTPAQAVFGRDESAITLDDLNEIFETTRMLVRILGNFSRILDYEIKNPDAEPHLLRGIFLPPLSDPFLAGTDLRIREEHARLNEALPPSE